MNDSIDPDQLPADLVIQEPTAGAFVDELRSVSIHSIDARESAAAAIAALHAGVDEESLERHLIVIQHALDQAERSRERVWRWMNGVSS